MRTYLLTAAMLIVCGLRLSGQEEPAVKIIINDEERFRFDSIQLIFYNEGHHVIIGDSAGTDDAANAVSEENTLIGFKTGNLNASGWNTFLGARAGEFHRTGRDNVYLGAWAGRYDTSGQFNTFVGANAGYKNHSGQMNTYMGRNTGFESDTSICNTFVGYNAGRDYHGVGYNSFFGRRAGEKNISGSENTFIGTSAGAECLTGSNNTFLGRAAGLYNTHGSGNVYIGNFAGEYDTASNKLIIANSNTANPLVWGDFCGVFGLNALRMEFRNVFENTIIGGNSGYTAYGVQNVIFGNSAGNSLKGGYGNTFIGYQAGLADTSGYHNVFIGFQSGYSNTSGYYNVFTGISAGASNTTGMRNTFMGLSAGAYNSTGSYNTYLGRIAGYYNETGDSNVFIGNGAGQNEMGSQKLYISNSGTSEPLIYGDFENKKLKFHADTVQATGEIRADEGFNVGGLPGITDTLNTVTSISFTQNKLKYRTTLISGGIITFMSLESEWSDTIEEYLIPCNAIGLMGEFNGGTNDLPMTRTSYNPSLWMLSVKFTIEDDLTEPADSIVEVKFRDNASWTVNWGSTDFPTGTGYQDGPYIPVPLCDYQDTTYYYIQFNCLTGEYSFEELTGLCGDPLIDLRDGKRYATVLIGDQCWMAQDLNVGTRIDGGTDQTDNGTVEKYCYNNLESNCTQWGGLYQWPELMDYVTTEGVRGICPDGFHIPTDAEFKILEGNVDSQFGPGSEEWDGTGFRGLDAGYRLKSASGWIDNGNGSDAVGFHALPGGYYSMSANGYFDGGSISQFLTSTLDTQSNMNYVRNMWSQSDQMYRNTNSTADGNNVRCLKD